MKNIIAVALISAVIAVPVFADDTMVKTSAKKMPPAANSNHKHAHKMTGSEDECDTVHGMGAPQGYGMMSEHGGGMMGGQDYEMMMKPDMHILGALALSEEQQSKINKLSDELKHNNWTTQGLINVETAKLRDLYEADKRDPAAISKEYQKVFDLKRQLIETYLDIQNRIEDTLTPEQRAQMKASRNKMHHMYSHSMQ